jgi:hypothetical protein
MPVFKVWLITLFPVSAQPLHDDSPSRPISPSITSERLFVWLQPCEGQERVNKRKMAAFRNTHTRFYAKARSY